MEESKNPRTKAKGHYHHGDLRQALLAAAIEIVEGEGLAALTLRSVSTKLGVSHSAPIYHFPNKSDLILALAEEGFRLFADELGQADQGDSLLARQKSVGAAYLRFAAQRPQHFRIMFGPELPSLATRTPGFLAESERAFAVLAAVSGEAETPDGLGESSLYCWGLVHGLAMLKLGPLPSRLPPGAEPWLDGLMIKVMERGLESF